MIKEEYLRYYIEENADVYFEKWQNKPAGKIYIGWNWATFFAGFYWLLYRKMYAEFAVLYGIKLALEKLLPLIGLPVLLADIVDICLYVFANSLYQRKVIKAIDKAVAKYGDDEEGIKNELITAGGTSFLSVVVFICIVVFLTFFTNMGALI
ncbi:DUF2628 domain-containing protein [Tyzzerella sp. OttesenSCG-928-J15]|nr:DUF2628 domain-containing protein [Tyzzerella sp. OttesenSCG-928-J15]